MLNYLPFLQVFCVVLAVLTSVILALNSTRGYHCRPELPVPEEFYIGAGALVFIFVSTCKIDSRHFYYYLRIHLEIKCYVGLFW